MSSTVWSGSKDFSANGGEATLVAVDVPHRAVIRSYNLVQTSGDALLLSSSREKEPNSGLPEASFLVETITLPNAASNVAVTNTSLAYLNRDGTPTSPQRKLYLKVTPGGSGAKNFVFSLTVETPNLL
jgi:hypothetical protein